MRRKALPLACWTAQLASPLQPYAAYAAYPAYPAYSNQHCLGGNRPPAADPPSPTAMAGQATEQTVTCGATAHKSALFA